MVSGAWSMGLAPKLVNGTKPMVRAPPFKGLAFVLQK